MKQRSSQKTHSTVVTALFLLAPFIVWLYLLRDFIFTNQMIVDDAVHFYDRIKYFLENIIRGQFPLWNYVESWGRPESLELRYFGEFNPFLWIVVLLQQIGLPYISAYLSYNILYYALGLIGFYLLASRLFNDQRSALAAYVLLMFSSIGTNLFNNFAAILLLVPIVWFFYFLVAFCRSYSRFHFLGLIFTLMILAMTYIPFYFLIIFLLFFLGFVVLYIREIRDILFGFWNFIKANNLLVITGMFCLGVSCLPGMLWYFQSGSEFVTPFRQGTAALNHPAAMDISVINVGGISGFVSLVDIFSGLQQTKVGTFYIPIFAYVLIALSVANTITRRLALLFGVSLILILISLADVTPVHQYLYEHVFFFKYFRILYFLFALTIPIVILFCADQFRQLLESPEADKEKKVHVLWFVLVVHGALAAFLYRQDDVIVSSYITVGLSLIFFLAHFSGVFKRQPIVFLGLMCAIMCVQPVEVFSHIRRNSEDLALVKNSKVQIAPYGQDHYLKPYFSYTRNTQQDTRVRSENQPFRTEHSGFLGQKYKGTKWSYYLYQNMDEQVLRGYVANKFYVYDEVVNFEDSPQGLNRLKEAFTNKDNVAFVSEWAELTQDSGRSQRRDVQVIEKNTDQFKVTGFDYNFIKFKTHFDQDKFVVYTDSFHSRWRAFINGQPAELYRANVAFKGVWVPAGSNTVLLRFGTKEIYAMHWAILAIFNGMFFAVLFLGITRIRHGKE